MLPIIKIYHQGKTDISKYIYVFLNNNWIEDNIFSLKDSLKELGEAVNRKDNDTLRFIFSETELKNIYSNNIPITFFAETLHLDDTIKTIKGKIIEKTGLSISLPEIYLYGIRREKLSPEALYNKLTQNDEIPLTRQRLLQFLQNFVRFNISDFKAEEDDDLSQANLLPYTKVPELIKFPIGQQIIIEKNYPYMVSPFGQFFENITLENYAEKIISTQNEYFLLEYGQLESNIIYMCTAEDVLKASTKITEKIKIKIYFPHLFKKKIVDLTSLLSNKQLLLNTNKKLIDSNFKKYNNNINLFYNLNFNKNVILPMNSFGIKYIHFIIHPITIINFPIDIIFKLISTSANIPLSKWNPGKRRENIYRLYTPQTSKDGRKIPKLAKSEIMKIMRTVGRKKSVSITIQLQKKNYIICEFFDNGNLSIKCSFEPFQDVVTIENILKKKINPILNTIAIFLEQSGYEYFTFENLHAKNIEIIDLHYHMTFPVAQKESLKNIPEFKTCLSSVFNIAENKGDGGDRLIYKRVAHFNKGDSMDAFITYLHKSEVSPPIIIKQLEEYFNIDNKEAIQEYSRWVDERQVERGRYENKKLKIISNPGFTVNIQWNDGEVDIRVQDIDNIYYLELLPIYLNSMIKLTQYKNLIGESEEARFTKRIDDMCKKGNAEIITFPEIKASNEKKFSDQTNVSANEGLVTFGSPEDIDDDLLDMFGGSESDEDDEDDDDDGDLSSFSQPSQQVAESSVQNEPMAQNIDGLSLSNPNYFQKRLENADPILFIKQKKGKFKQYSRSCAVNIRRQPVLLTDKEFQKIKNESPEKIKMAVKYGSDPDKKFWYICPQYWCLTENRPLTKDDLEEAKRNGTKLCGDSNDPYQNIIPHNAKTVPKGKYIYSRVDFGQKKRKQVQETLYPSFFVGKHPNPKLCIPCCFNKPGGKQTRNREKCGAEVWDIHKQGKKSIPQLLTKTKVIKESGKFPLEKEEWGFLPMNIYNFLDIPYSYSNCNSDGETCILRKGVQYSPNQSFIAAIATILNPNKPLSIEEMKKKIIRVITFDLFITYQHGTLVEIFKTKKRNPINESEYKSTILYKKLINQKIGKEYLKEIISAYENFQNYLRDDKINIDYEYLWDIICTKNELLFEKGLNLIILTIPQNDITQKVDIICPSNHYSTNLFVGGRPTAIILLREGFFEPILERQKIARGKNNIKSTFSLKGKACFNRCPWTLQTIIRQIGNKIKTKCGFIKPRDRFFGQDKIEKNKRFAMKHNIPAKKIYKILKKKTDYTFYKQVINEHTKVIGIIVVNSKKRKEIIFVPCAPSPIGIGYAGKDKDSGDATILINEDTSWWNSYKESVRLLNDIASFGGIPCKPRFKVIDDGKIIGILTQTNQLVPTKPETVENTNGDKLVPYNINTNIIKANEKIWSSTKKDAERLETVKKIKLETNFYNTFRNTVRILLNQYKFKKIKEKIEEKIRDPSISYWIKLDNIIKLLKNLVSPFTEFVEININDVDAISTCLNFRKDTCNTKFCGFSAAKDICQLLIPKENLISGNDNENIYYGRMSDELIRYGRVQTFLLKHNKFISFQKIDYNLKNNEVLLLEEILTDKYKNYFKNFDPIDINKYITHPQTFYSANPLEHPPYAKEFVLDH